MFQSAMLQTVRVSGNTITHCLECCFQSMLESLTANQCFGLTSVALQLPPTLPLKELSISGDTPDFYS